MKNLLLVVSVALLGACANYTPKSADKECCTEAQSMGKECCEAMGDCANACPEGKEMAQCCKDAAALGKDCPECTKKP